MLYQLYYNHSFREDRYGVAMLEHLWWTYLLRALTYLLPAYWVLAILAVLLLSGTSSLHYNDKPPLPASLLSVPSHIAWPLFYLVGLLTTALLRLLPAPIVTHPSLSLTFFFLHTLRRLVESLHLTRFGSRRVSPLHFAAGISYYLVVPLSLAVEAGPQSCGRWATVLAALLFGVASTGQFLAHVALASLKGLGGKVGKYGVPRGGLFEMVAAPHYFWEIAIYLVLVRKPIH